MAGDPINCRAVASVLAVLRASHDPRINDVTEEGDDTIIVTVDHGDSYEVVRLDVTSLGEDELPHD